jgi:uncharacterized protein (TIGR02145 family)
MYNGDWRDRINGQGSIGYYWSSTQYSAVSSYSMYFNSSAVNQGVDIYTKQSGFAIRCVAS